MHPNVIGGVRLVHNEGEVVMAVLQATEPPIDPSVLHDYEVANNTYDLSGEMTATVAARLRTVLETRPNSFGLKELVNIRLLVDKFDEYSPAP